MSLILSPSPMGRWAHRVQTPKPTACSSLKLSSVCCPELLVTPLLVRSPPGVSKAGLTPKKQETQPRAKSSGRQMCLCLQLWSRASRPPPSSGAVFRHGESHSPHLCCSCCLMELGQSPNPLQPFPGTPNHTSAQAQPFRTAFTPTDTQQQRGFRDQLGVCDGFDLKCFGAYTLPWVPKHLCMRTTLSILG